MSPCHARVLNINIRISMFLLKHLELAVSSSSSIQMLNLSRSASKGPIGRLSSYNQAIQMGTDVKRNITCLKTNEKATHKIFPTQFVKKLLIIVNRQYKSLNLAPLTRPKQLTQEGCLESIIVSHYLVAQDSKNLGINDQSLTCMRICAQMFCKTCIRFLYSE